MRAGWSGVGTVSLDAKIKKRIRSERLQMLWLFVSIVLVVAVLWFMFFAYKKMEDGKFYQKDLVMQDLKVIVTNGGGLGVIKHAVSYFPPASEISVLVSSSDRYYSQRTPLAIILNDLRLDAFKNDDKVIQPILEALISEYEEVNPFEGLPPEQKDRFENIRVKSGESYVKVSGDVNGVAEELRRKNLLVEDYLADSKMSFIISIFAVLLSLAIGSYQIFAARPKAMKRMFSEILEIGEQDRNKKPGHA